MTSLDISRSTEDAKFAFRTYSKSLYWDRKPVQVELNGASSIDEPAPESKKGRPKKDKK